MKLIFVLLSTWQILSTSLLLKDVALSEGVGAGPSYENEEICAVGPPDEPTMTSVPCSTLEQKYGHGNFVPNINTDTTGELALLILFPSSCYPCPLNSILCPHYLWQCVYLNKPLWWIRDHFYGPPTGMTVGNCKPLGYPSNNGPDGWHPQVVSHSWLWTNLPNKTATDRILTMSEFDMSLRKLNQNPWCLNPDAALLYPGGTGKNPIHEQSGYYCYINWITHLVAFFDQVPVRLHNSSLLAIAKWEESHYGVGKGIQMNCEELAQGVSAQLTKNTLNHPEPPLDY